MLMLGEPRIGVRALGDLSRRLGISVASGIDIRRTWTRESENARGAARRVYSSINDAVARGVSVSDAMDDTGQYFPLLFRQLVRVGEQSGHLAEVFAQLSDHYEHVHQLRRSFLRAITWPLVELAAALTVVGLLIWIMGMIGSRNPGQAPIDLLGLGLMGTPGLIRYVTFLAVVGVVIAVLVRAMLRGALWARPLQKVVLRLPKIGRCLDTFSLARLAWSLNVTMNSGMELRQALDLSYHSTNNSIYIEQVEPIWASIRQGHELYEAMALHGSYPVDFLDTVQVGEESGRLVESLGRLSRRYQEEAQMTLGTLTSIAGGAVWCLVAGIIILIIYRIFSVYVGTINDAMKGI